MDHDIKTLSGQSLSVPDFRNIPSVYVNSASVIMTPFDVRFLFSEIVAIDEGKIEATARASIVMSRAHLRAFLDLVEQQLKVHEVELNEK